LATGRRARKVSSVELVSELLGRIERIESGPGALNAFISVTRAQALEAARVADRALGRGSGGALAGVPIAHKDIFCTAGVRTTCGSRMLAHFIQSYHADAVSQLKARRAAELGQ